jgi:hypothetical protein
MNKQLLPFATQLADFVAAKICHDFATPLNAMCLTLEMLEDSHGKISREDISIIKQSYEQLHKKLSILRLLFSCTKSVVSNISDAIEIFKTHTKNAGISFFLFLPTDPSVFEQSPHQANIINADNLLPKLWICLLLMISESLHRGGIVNIYVHHDFAELRVNSPKAMLKDSYRNVLSSTLYNNEPITPNGQNSLAIYATAVAELLRFDLSYESGDEEFSIFVKKADLIQ